MAPEDEEDAIPTCLSVREDASVVPVEGIVQDVGAERVEHSLLWGERRQRTVQRVETVIERERFRLFPARGGCC